MKMLSLSPPPPPFPPSPPPQALEPPTKKATPISLNQIVIPKHTKNIESPNLEKLRKQAIFLTPRPHRTNLFIWCWAILCLVFSILVIFSGIATLIIFTSIKPRIPVFDTPTANLNAIYFDSPEYFNGDFTFLANFSNPNGKLDLRFEYVDMELYFCDRLIATRVVEPFSQRRKETRLESVHLLSSLVYMPGKLAMELGKQVMNNTIKYNMRGTFKVRASLGMVHFSYWLHARCHLVMTGPPYGVLIAHTCKTKR